MKLQGMAAIEAAEAAQPIRLCKYADPIEGARENITPAEARDVAREDAGLIYGIAINQWSGLEYGQSVRLPDGRAGTVGHLCSDIDGQTGYVNVVVGEESVHIHSSQVAAQAAERP